MFDANSFLDMTVDGAMDTKHTPCPVGEYLGVAEKVEARQWTKKDDPTKSGVTLEVHWVIEDDGVKQALGRDRVIVKQGVMLDITDSGGMDLSKGKNIGLGKLRAAVDLNNPGQAFAPSMITGRMAKVKVGHRINGEDIYAEVQQVAHV